MWRDERGSATSWDQAELGRYDPSSGLPHGIEKRTDPGRQGGDLRAAGAVVNGPCLLVQPDATIYVDPGLAARVDDLGNIIIKE